MIQIMRSGPISRPSPSNTPNFPVRYGFPPPKDSYPRPLSQLALAVLEQHLLSSSRQRTSACHRHCRPTSVLGVASTSDGTKHSQLVAGRDEGHEEGRAERQTHLHAEVALVGVSEGEVLLRWARRRVRMVRLGSREGRRDRTNVVRDVPLGRVDCPHLGGGAPGSGADGGLADSCEGEHGEIGGMLLDGGRQSQIQIGRWCCGAASASGTTDRS